MRLTSQHALPNDVTLLTLDRLEKSTTFGQAPALRAYGNFEALQHFPVVPTKKGPRGP